MEPCFFASEKNDDLRMFKIYDFAKQTLQLSSAKSLGCWENGSEKATRGEAFPNSNGCLQRVVCHNTVDERNPANHLGCKKTL